MSNVSLIPEKLDKPGTHVLVIGVSKYLHFKDGEEPTSSGKSLRMRQLSSAARSASEFAAWMLNEYNNSNSELSSLRVLLSPSDGEEIHPDIMSKLSDGDFSATINNVEQSIIQFRNACLSDPENIAIIYLAGHGVQLTKTGSILLLSDCCSNNHATTLKGSIDVMSLHAGFDRPDIAQSQFWFVDACRQIPDIAAHFETLEGGFGLDQTLAGIAESSPVFLAAITGNKAYAYKSGVSLFCTALLKCLRGGFANEPEDGFSDFYHVSVLGLVKTLKNMVQKLAEAEHATQTVDPSGRVNEAVFYEYPETPEVDLTIDLLPNDAWPVTSANVRDEEDQLIAENLSDWPVNARLKAGIYEIVVNSTADFKKATRLVNLEPPELTKKIDVNP